MRSRTQSRGPGEEPRSSAHAFREVGDPLGTDYISDGAHLEGSPEVRILGEVNHQTIGPFAGLQSNSLVAAAEGQAGAERRPFCEALELLDSGVDPGPPRAGFDRDEQAGAAQLWTKIVGDGPHGLLCAARPIEQDENIKGSRLWDWIYDRNRDLFRTDPPPGLGREGRGIRKTPPGWSQSFARWIQQCKELGHHVYTPHLSRSAARRVLLLRRWMKELPGPPQSPIAPWAASDSLPPSTVRTMEALAVT